MRKISILMIASFVASSILYAQMPEPAVVLKTAKFAGESLAIQVAEYSGTVVIDWGNGSYESVAVNSKFDLFPTLISATLPVDEATIKIYGDIVNLRVGEQMLTQLSLGSVPKLRRLDCQNNLLTSLEGLSEIESCGTIFGYGNLFDACAIEAIYYSIIDRTLKPNGTPNVVGILFLMDTSQSDDQNKVVIDSKISIVNAKNWNITNNIYGWTEALANPIFETTGIGCETGLKSVLGDKVDYSYEPTSGLLKVNTNSGINKLLIYDATGKTKYTKVLKSNESFIMSIKDYSPGLYFIRLNNDVKKLLVAY